MVPACYEVVPMNDADESTEIMCGCACYERG